MATPGNWSVACRTKGVLKTKRRHISACRISMGWAALGWVTLGGVGGEAQVNEWVDRGGGPRGGSIGLSRGSVG